MNAPRVLLVEDDAAIRRFVEAVLEDLDVELHTTDCIAEAMAALMGAPFALVLTDLMLAGESGRSLVERLHGDPSLACGPRVAVLSAGLSPEVAADLQQLGAWRLLHKPVSVDQLRRCVLEAVESGAAPGAVAPAAQGDVIDTYFGGNMRVYLAYRSACELQFPIDIAQGDRALELQDAPAMRRLGHSLKSVLLALGHTQAAEHARALDTASAGVDWEAVHQHWPRLRAGLWALIEQARHRPG